MQICLFYFTRESRLGQSLPTPTCRQAGVGEVDTIILLNKKPLRSGFNELFSLEYLSLFY